MAPSSVRAQRHLVLAVAARDAEAVRRALQRGADPNFTFAKCLSPVWDALRVKAFDVLRELTRAGGCVDVLHTIDGYEPTTAVAFATCGGTVEQLQFCLDHSRLGVNGYHGRHSLLIYSIVFDRRDNFDLLIKRGADVRMRLDGISPIEYCFRYLNRFDCDVWWFVTRLHGMGVRMDDWIIHDPLVVDVKQLQWLTVHYRERVETFEYVKWVCEHLHSRHLRVLYEAGVHVHTWHVCAAIMKNPCMCMAQACVDILDLNTLDGYDREGYAPLHRAIMVNSPGLIARIVERGCAIKADMVGMKCSEIAAWHCSAYVTSTLQLIEEVPLELNASMRVVCADALRNAYIDTSV